MSFRALVVRRDRPARGRSCASSRCSSSTSRASSTSMQFDELRRAAGPAAAGGRVRARRRQPRRLGRRRGRRRRRAGRGVAGMSVSEPGIPASSDARVVSVRAGVSEPSSVGGDGAARDRGGRPGRDRAGRGPPARAAGRAPGRPGSRSSATSSRREYEATERGFVLAQVAGGYRFQTHPDLARLRRALRARGPARPALGAGARDARDRRLQAADLPRPAVGDPRRQRRGDAQHAVAARATSQEVGHDPAPGNRGALRHHRAVPRAARPGLARRPARRSATSSPTPSVVEALERGLRLSDDPQEPRAGATPRPRRAPTPPPASD